MGAEESDGGMFCMADEGTDCMDGGAGCCEEMEGTTSGFMPGAEDTGAEDAVGMGSGLSGAALLKGCDEFTG